MSELALDQQAENPRFIDVDEEDGGRFVAVGKDKIVIIPRSCNKNEVSIETINISHVSDTHRSGHNYGGVIIYQYNGKSEWKTANDTHCESAYIVIQDTDSHNVRRWMSKEPGVVHGAVYRNAFGESVKGAEIVGEGFAVRNGKFEMCSGVFNNPSGSVFHDSRKRMHELSEHCVRKIVEYWKTAGSAFSSWSGTRRNFRVKELLKDFTPASFKRKFRHISIVYYNIASAMKKLYKALEHRSCINPEKTFNVTLV